MASYIHESAFFEGSFTTPYTRKQRSSRPPLAYKTPRLRSTQSTRDFRPSTPVMQSSMSSPPSCFDLRPTNYNVSRRSVSCMKQLLPLRLASPTSATRQFFESPPLSPASATYSAPERCITPLPWMLPEGDAPFIGHVTPKKYRETPVYSEPGSPLLARAYSNGEEEYAISDSMYGRPGIVGSYEAQLLQSASSNDEFADCDESFDEDSESDSGSGSESDGETSVSTAPTSLDSNARYSDLSIKCRGEIPQGNGAMWSKGLSAKPSLAEAFDETRTSRCPSTLFDEWAESDCSRCSSPDNFLEIASATQLVPLRPQVVEVHSPSMANSFPPRQSSLPPRRPTRAAPTAPLTPPPARKDVKGPVSRPVTPTNTTVPDVYPSPPKRRRAPLHISMPPVKITDENLLSPPLSPLGSPLGSPFQAALTYTKSVPRFKFEVHDIVDEVIAMPLIESICDTIDGSPRDLQLDSYCITEIRRLNRQARYSAAQVTTPPAVQSEDPFRSDYRAKAASRRSRSRSKSIFQFKSSKSQTVSLSSTSAIPPPLNIHRFPQIPEAKAPNLASLRSIFPCSDDWWRGVLYAHLLAYNYVGDMRAARRTAIPSSLPSKATRTLGLPMEPSLRNASTADEEDEARCRLDASFDAILTGLASCITRITSCMAGDYNRIRANLDGSKSLTVDVSFVRALSEIVKVAELNCDILYETSAPISSRY